MAKTAIVTGCCGFIGTNLTRSLLNDGWRVYGIDKSNRTFSDLRSSYFTFAHKDILELDYLPNCDVLFNLAANSYVDSTNNNFLINNVATVQHLLNLLDNYVTISVDKPLFFHFSTDEVYGPAFKNSHSTEHSALNPQNVYAATKASADLLIKSWLNTHPDFKYVIVRPSNNYGEYQYHEKLIPLVVKRVTSGKPIKLHNNGTPLRTWTHVQDTIRAVKLILESNASNTIYNISSMEEYSNEETVRLIFKYLREFNPRIDYNYNRVGQDFRYLLNTDKIRELGWKNIDTLEDNMRNLVEHYKERFEW